MAVTKLDRAKVAIVTQHPYSLPEGLPPLPVKTVSADPAALRDALVSLRDDRAGRQALEAEARTYFDRWLGADALREAWRAIVSGD